MKKRLKSKVVWLAVIAQVCVLLSMINKDMSDSVKVVLTTLAEIATLFGILNNPTTNKEF